MKRLLFVLLLMPALGSVAQTPATTGKVGYVDIAYVYSQLPEMKQMEQTFTETRQRLSDQYTAKREQLQQMYNDISSKYESMSDTARAQAEKRFSQLQAEVQQFPDEADKTLENTRKLYMAPIYLSIGTAISEVAEENGYSMLIPTVVNNENLVLYADKSFDASQLVIKKMLERSAQTEQQHPTEQQPGVQKPVEQKAAVEKPAEQKSGKKSGKKKQ